MSKKLHDLEIFWNSFDDGTLDKFESPLAIRPVEIKDRVQGQAHISLGLSAAGVSRRESKV